MSALSAVLSTLVGRCRKFGEVSCTECIGQGNDFELIPDQNSVPKVFIATPIDVLCSQFAKFCWREIGEIVRCLPDKKQNFAWLSSCRYCADPTQNLPGPAPDNILRVLPISSKSVPFGGVIAERVNTAKTRRKVNPIIGWSLASSRIKSKQYKNKMT